MPFAASIALAVSVALSGSQAAAQQVSSIQPMPAAQTVEEYVRAYFYDEPIMQEIARCESHFKQFDTDGSVHRGLVNRSDIGVMQVNEYYHGKTADKLGLDLYTIQGNLSYARYLFDKEGATPWNSSKPCWGKSEAAKVLALK